MISRDDLVWRGDELFAGRRSAAPILRVVRDETYPSMWRVEHDGKFSDMVNRTRARDAAQVLTLSILNEQRYRESASGAPSSAPNGSGAISLPLVVENAPAAAPSVANSGGVANKPQRDRAAYMRDYMRRRRGVVREGRQA